MARAKEAAVSTAAAATEKASEMLQVRGVAWQGCCLAGALVRHAGRGAYHRAWAGCSRADERMGGVH